MKLVSIPENFGQRFGCNLGWRIWSESNFQKDPQAKFGRTEKGKVSFAGSLGWTDHRWMDDLHRSLDELQNAPVCAWVFPYQLIDILEIILDILDSALDLDLKQQKSVIRCPLPKRFFLFDTSTVDGNPVHVFFRGSWTTGTSEKMIFRDGAGSKGFEIADDAKNPSLFWLHPSAGSLAPA